MSNSRNYDTVAFDVKENATMLFFAKTTDTGDIGEYLLLMRAEGEGYDDAIYIEINEQQFAGHDKIREARLAGNVLTLELNEPQQQFENCEHNYRNEKEYGGDRNCRERSDAPQPEPV